MTWKVRFRESARRVAGLWRYRVGDYRIICLIKDADLLVEVVAVGRRTDIY